MDPESALTPTEHRAASLTLLYSIADAGAREAVGKDPDAFLDTSSMVPNPAISSEPHPAWHREARLGSAHIVDMQTREAMSADPRIASGSHRAWRAPPFASLGHLHIHSAT